MSEEPLMSMRSLEREMNHRAERLMQAMKRIAELEAERDALKIERGFVREECQQYSNAAARLLGESETLRAENARLRQALADAPHAKTCDSWEDDMPCDCWKAALARPPEAK